MIMDSHCLAWEKWPYAKQVPDSQTRASVEQLIREMDEADVESAVMICAAIGDNPHNVDYAIEAALRHDRRFVVFPDLECRWDPAYRTPGAAARLERALARWDFAGFTMYFNETEDGSWIDSEEGRAFFDLAAENWLVASLSVVPHQMPAVSALAARHPTMPVLCHHNVHLGPRAAAIPDAVGAVTAAAQNQNIFIKVSGFGSVAEPQDSFPYSRFHGVIESLRNSFGPDRMIWGSDYPVSSQFMTYRQTISAVRDHEWFAPDELPSVMGGTIARILSMRRV